jgi:hypothetical protein
MVYRLPMRASRTIAWGFLVAVMAAGGPAAGAAQSGNPFGFEVGEARHYVLGPEEALAPGEMAFWITTLESVEGAAGSRRFVFRLQHRREAPRTIRNPPAPGAVVNAQVDAELTVNEQGAPLSLQYVSQRHIRDVGDEVFQVTYSHSRGRYKKEVALQGWNWDYDVEMIAQQDLDPRRPAGLFAFAPAALQCMEWEVGARMERRIGSGDTSAQTPTAAGAEPEAGEPPAAADTSTLAGRCNELNTDPAFANPGLLGLAMPTLWDRRGDGELVLFAPLRPDLVRGEANRIPITFAPIIPIIPNVPGSRFLGNIMPGLSFESLFGGGRVAGDKERARDPRRYFFASRLSLDERQRIEVGPRSMDALPLAIEVPVAGAPGASAPAPSSLSDGFAAAPAASSPSGGFARAWIDDWGKVLRIDLYPAPEGPARFIRLLHPSEY